MTDDKMISERDAVKRERAAWVEGYCRHANGRVGEMQVANAAHFANGLYPMPKVKRLRVVTDPYTRGVEWRVGKEGNIERRTHLQYDSYDGDRAWKEDLGSFMAAPLRVAVWADLLANPTEEVDADD